jgi:hypothetical protein
VKVYGGATLGANTFTGAQTIAGNLLFSPDATHDIGATAASRPRDIHTSRDVNVGRNINGGGSVQAASTSQMYFNSRTTLQAPANGTLQVGNFANNAGATLDFTTDNTIKFSDRAGTAAATMQFGAFAAGAGETFAGTITIKDYAGNNRKVAVFA